MNGINPSKALITAQDKNFLANSKLIVKKNGFVYKITFYIIFCA
jgi:hypothetical protein